MEVLTAEQVTTIIESSLDVLEQQGMRFLEDESRKILRLAGATQVDGDCMIRFDRGMVLEMAALAPSQLPLRACTRKAVVPLKRWICHRNRGTSTCISLN